MLREARDSAQALASKPDFCPSGGSRTEESSFTAQGLWGQQRLWPVRTALPRGWGHQGGGKQSSLLEKFLFHSAQSTHIPGVGQRQGDTHWEPPSSQAIFFVIFCIFQRRHAFLI